MKTDTSERGLEALIAAQMTGGSAASAEAVGFAEDPEPFVGLPTGLPAKRATTTAPGRSISPNDLPSWP